MQTQVLLSLVISPEVEDALVDWLLELLCPRVVLNVGLKAASAARREYS